MGKPQMLPMRKAERSGNLLDEKHRIKISLITIKGKRAGIRLLRQIRMAELTA